MNIVGTSLLIFFVLLVFEVPIVISIGVTCIAIWLQNPAIATNPQFIFQGMSTSLDSFVLVAIPLFILSGNIMAKGGIAGKLFDFFSYFTGKYKAGLPITVIITCLFYGALSGSAPATAAAVGGMAVPVLINMGYSLEFSAAIVAVAGGLGVIIPPSIPMIVYGSATGASIGTMFIAGVLPGFLIAACMIVYAIYYCMKNPPNMDKLQSNYRRLHDAGFRKTFFDSFFALLTPVIILGGIYSGIFTPSEAAAISVIYALVVSIFVYRTMKVSEIPAVVKDAVATSAPIMIIIAISGVFGRALALLQVTRTVSDFILGNFPGKIAILLFINLLLLFIGCVMDTTPAILIFAPILWPICEALGMSIIQFGIIMVCNLAIGFVTPPIGLNLFVVSSFTKVPILKLAKQALPFIIAFFIALMLITFVPAISLTLVGGA
ncbi:MAG: TRAP transporter large permease [Lachnospiraceae bacterium]|nr:TRAP transporter large permease [Lachnospiraceae bacterium]